MPQFGERGQLSKALRLAGGSCSFGETAKNDRITRRKRLDRPMEIVIMAGPKRIGSGPVNGLASLLANNQLLIEYEETISSTIAAQGQVQGQNCPQGSLVCRWAAAAPHVCRLQGRRFPEETCQSTWPDCRSSQNGLFGCQSACRHRSHQAGPIHGPASLCWRLTSSVDPNVVRFISDPSPDAHNNPSRILACPGQAFFVCALRFEYWLFLLPTPRRPVEQRAKTL